MGTTISISRSAIRSSYFSLICENVRFVVKRVNSCSSYVCYQVYHRGKTIAETDDFLRVCPEIIYRKDWKSGYPSPFLIFVFAPVSQFPCIPQRYAITGIGLRMAQVQWIYQGTDALSHVVFPFPHIPLKNRPNFSEFPVRKRAICSRWLSNSSQVVKCLHRYSTSAWYAASSISFVCS